MVSTPLGIRHVANRPVPVPQEQGLLEIPGDDPDHQFEYPRASDVRGMCPTLNTMANHGFIARNGITTFAEAANACQITVCALILLNQLD